MRNAIKRDGFIQEVIFIVSVSGHLGPSWDTVNDAARVAHWWIKENERGLEEEEGVEGRR